MTRFLPFSNSNGLNIAIIFETNIYIGAKIMFIAVFIRDYESENEVSITAMVGQVIASIYRR